MENKNNVQKRASHSRLISEKEDMIDELSNEKRKIEESIYRLEEELRRDFQTLNMLHNEIEQLDTSGSSQLQRNNEKQEQISQQLLREINEQIAITYEKQTKKIDEERENLYKKRSELSWE